MYLDGELQPVEQKKLEEHLITCSACSRRLAESRQEDALISSALASTPLPADLTAVIRRRLLDVESGGGRWLHLVLPALLLISMLASLAFNWLPLAERIREAAGMIVGGVTMLELGLLAARAVASLAEAATAGSSLLPAATVLLICVVWLRAKIRKGGYAHV